MSHTTQSVFYTYSIGKILAISTSISLWGTQLNAMGLEDFLSRVQAKNSLFQSFEKSIEAAGQRRLASDMALVPSLTLKTASMNDQRPQTLGSFVIDKTSTQEYSLGLSKLFSTGTQASLSSAITQTTSQATVAGSSTGYSQAYGSMGVSLSQSLWRNAFGSATRLRWEREKAQEKSEKSALELQRRQALIEAESAFWDYLYLKEELEQRQSSLERANRIVTWVERRFANGIGDRADVLNAKALRATRDYQLLTSRDLFEASQKKLKDILNLNPDETLPEISGELSQPRSPQSLANLGSGRAVRLDSYLSLSEAKMKALSSEEVLDSQRPDLVLSGAYKTNPTDSTMDLVAPKISNNVNPTTNVALVFTWNIDGEVKRAARNAAKADALASRLKQEQKLRESDTSWNEINRRHEELSKLIKAASLMKELQNQKAAVERDKLSKGRSITSQVITAEQDAAESALTLTKLLAEQRKLEAQARLYVGLEEGT